MESRTLAQYIAGLKYEDLSDKTVSMAKQSMLDWLGVCIRGSQEPPIKIIRKILLEAGGNKESSVFAGNNMQTSILQGAFCNGSASHSLDFDDLHNASIIHFDSELERFADETFLETALPLKENIPVKDFCNLTEPLIL